MADKPDPKAENAKDNSSEPVKPTTDNTATKADAGDSHVVTSANPNVQTDVTASSMTDAVAKAQSLNKAEKQDQTGTHIVTGKKDVVFYDSTKEAPPADEPEVAEDKPTAKSETKSEPGSGPTETTAEAGKDKTTPADKPETSAAETKPDAQTETVLAKLPADYQKALEGLPPEARANFAKQIDGMEGDFAKKMQAEHVAILVKQFNHRTNNGAKAEAGETIAIDGTIRAIQTERNRTSTVANRGGSSSTAALAEATAPRAEVTDPNHGTIAETRQPVKRDTSSATAAAAPNDTPSSQVTTGDVPVTVVDRTAGGASRSTDRTTNGVTPTVAELTASDPRKAEAAQRQAAGDKQVGDFIAAQTGETPRTPDSRKALALQGFEPKAGAYNPVTVPGFSEEGVGQQHTSTVSPKYSENYGIKSRQMTSMAQSGDNTVRTYSGEINNGAILGLMSGTTFQGHETVNKFNRLESRSVTYSSPLELSFDTPSGPKKIADVKQVDTKYDAANDRYVSTIRSADGTQHEAIVKTDGSVEKFEQTVKLTTSKNDKGVETKVWQDKAGTITQVQEGDERWSKQGNTDKWVKQNANGDYVDANNKVVSSASEAVSFTGRYEQVSTPKPGLARIDTAQQQATVKYADGSQERIVGLKGAPEYTVQTSADGKVSMDVKSGGKFSVDAKNMEVMPNGDIKFTDSSGNKVLTADGSLTSIYPDRSKGFQSVTEGFDANGQRYIKSIDFGAKAKINGVEMSGTWTRNADGKLQNGSKIFDGELKVKDAQTLSYTVNTADGIKGEGELRGDGTSYTSYYDAAKNYSRSVEGLADGSTVEKRFSWTAEEQKELKERYGDNLRFTEITRTDAKGQSIKVIEATPPTGTQDDKYIVQATDPSGRTWALLSQTQSKWGEIDSQGKPVKGISGEQNTFTGNWSMQQKGTESSTITRFIGSQDQKTNTFDADFAIDYKSNGEISITNMEVPMFGYNTDATIGPSVTRGANGDLTITSANMKDQITIRASGDIVTSDLALHPYGTTGLTEGTDANGKKYVKEITFNGDSTVGPGAGTWRRSGDSSSEKWEQIDASGKATGKTFDGEIQMNARLIGDMTIKDNKKHTVDGVVVGTGFERHEQYANNNKDLISSSEKAPDKSTITHEVTDDSKTVKEYGLDEKVKPPVDKTVVTDANGNKITQYTAKNENGDNYTVRIDGPSGTWIRGGDDKSNQWNKVSAEKNEKGDSVYKPTGESFYGNVERVGKTAIFTNDRDNQRTYYQPDGSFERQLLSEKTEVLSNLDVRSSKQPEYTIRSEVNGTRTVTDNTTGTVYTTVDGGGNKLVVDDKGNMTFKDGDGKTITIAQDGSRKIVDASSNELTTDAGGRMLQQKDANGKIVASYNYEQNGDQVHLKSFENSSGYWEMTQLPDGKQKWDLMNGKDGATATLEADRIYINRDNSMVLESGTKKTVRKLDGTEIVQDTVMTGDVTQTTVVVGKREGDTFTPAYKLKTITDKHEIQTQELESAGERAVRGADGVWTSTDLKTGEITKFKGQVSIDDSGTLRKVIFENDKNSDGTPRISNTVEVYTNGTSWQVYENGAKVYRDRDGDVQYRRSAAGEETRVDYSTTQPKEVVGFSQGNTYWKFNKDTGSYVPTDINNQSKILDQQNDAKVLIAINNRNGDMIRTNLVTGDINTSKLDGTTELHRKDDTRVYTDSQGRPTKQIDANKNEFDLTYGKDGQLSSIKAKIYTGVNEKGDATYQEMMVRTADYNGPGADKAIVGKNLKIEGFNDRYLAYENSKGHRVEIYPDRTMREYAGKDVNSGVIRVDLPNKTTVLAKGYDEKGSEPPFGEIASRGPIIRDAEIIGTPKTDFDRLKALGKPVPPPPVTPQEIKSADRSVIYKNADGNVVERWANGATQEFQKVPKTPGSSETVTRIKSSTDSTGRYIEYKYDDSQVASTVPNRVEITTMVTDDSGKKVPSKSILNRDKDGNATWTEAGKEPIAIKNFSVLENRIMISHADDPKNQKFLEFIDTRYATTQIIGKDRSVTDLDSTGRMTHKRDAAGNEFYFSYKGNDTVPSSLTNTYGSWVRQADANNPNPKSSDQTTWVNAETGDVWKGTVSTENGVYKFVNADGKRTEHKADGTDVSTYSDDTVEISKGGKVQSITDTAGNTTKYTYGEDGTAPYPTDFKVYNSAGKLVASSDSFTEKGPNGLAKDPIAKIEIDPSTGRPIVTYASQSVMTVGANGVGVVKDRESKVVGLYRPEDHKFIEAGKNGVKEITVDAATGKVEIINSNGTAEHFKSEGTRVVTDAAGNPTAAYSNDGKTVLNYEYAKGKNGQPELSSLTRTTTGDDGKSVVTKIVKEGDKFVEKTGSSEADLKATGNTYSSMSTFSDNVYFYNKEQKTQRTIDANGTEWEVRRFGEGSDERFTRIERDAQGRVTTVQDQNFNITHFVRNENGELTRVIQGEDELNKTKDNTWVSSANPDLQIHLKDGATGPIITSNGDQIWQDKDNVTRTVKADGSVEIDRPNGSRTIISADGQMTRTIYAADKGGEVQEVRAGKDGSVEVIMRNGDVLKQSAYSKIITSTTRTPAEFEGSLEVGKDGQLTFFTLSDKSTNVYYSDGSAKYLSHVVTGDIGKIVSQDLKDKSPETIKAITDAIKARPTDAESVLKEYGIDLDSPQGRQLMKDLDAAMMYTDKNSENVYQKLSDVGAVGPYRIDNEFNMNDARDNNPMNRGLDALNRSSYTPGQAPGNAQQPTQQTNPKPTNPPPGSDMGTGAPPITDRGQARNVVDENARRIDATLQNATRADGSKLSSSDRQELAAQLSANPNNAEALLREKGFSPESAKTLSGTIIGQHDTANDTAKDDIIKKALADGGVPANRVDEIAAQIKADPNNIEKILERNSVPADNIPKIANAYKADVAALEKASGSIISDNLKRSGLPADQQTEVAAKIQAHPENALQILKDAGVPEANATRIANEINKDMRTFNQIREAAETRNIDPKTAAAVALENYNNPENVAAALVRAGSDPSVAREVSRQAARDISTDNVIVAPRPDVVAPAQNGHQTEVIRIGSRTNVNDNPPNTTDVVNNFNRSQAQVEAMIRAGDQQRAANFEQKKELNSKADQTAERIGDDIMISARREQERARELETRRADEAKAKEERGTQSGEKVAEERRMEQKQQEEERSRRETEQRKQAEELQQRQEREMRDLEERRNTERDLRTAKENLQRQQEKARRELELKQKQDADLLKKTMDDIAAGKPPETKKTEPETKGKFELPSAQEKPQTQPVDTKVGAPTAPVNDKPSTPTPGSVSTPPESRPTGSEVSKPATAPTPPTDTRSPVPTESRPVTDSRTVPANATTPSADNATGKPAQSTASAPATVSVPATAPKPDSATTKPSTAGAVDSATGRPAGSPGTDATPGRPGTSPAMDAAAAKAATAPGAASAPAEGALRRDAAGNYTKIDASGNVIKVDATGKPIAGKDAPSDKTGTLGPDGKPVEAKDTKGDTTKPGVEKGDNDNPTPVVVPGGVNQPTSEVVNKPAGTPPTVPADGGALDRIGTPPASDIVKTPGKMSETVAENTVDKVTPQPGPTLPSAGNTTTANQTTGTQTGTPAGKEPTQTVPAGQTQGQTQTAPGTQTAPATTDPLNKTTVDPSGHVSTLPTNNQSQTGQGQTQTTAGKEPSTPAGTTAPATPAGTLPTHQQGQGQGQGQTTTGQDPAKPVPGSATAPQPAGQGQPQQPSTTPTNDPLNRTTTPTGTAGTQTPAGQTPAGQTTAGQTPAGQTPTGQTPTQQTPTGHTQPAQPQAPTGQDPAQTTGQTTGQNSTGQSQTGHTPAGQTPTGQTPTGQTPAGQTPAGQTTTGHTPTSQTGPDPLPKSSTDPGTTTQVPSGQAPAGHTTPNATTPTGQSAAQNQPNGQTGQPATPPATTNPQAPQAGQGQTTSSTTTGQEPSQQLPKGQSDPNSTGQAPQGTQPTPGHSTTTPSGQTTTTTPTGQEPSQQAPGQTPTQGHTTTTPGQTTQTTQTGHTGQTGQTGQEPSQQLPKQSEPGSATTTTGQLPAQGQSGQTAPGHTGQTSQQGQGQGNTPTQGQTGQTQTGTGHGQTTPAQGQGQTQGQTDPQGQQTPSLPGGQTTPAGHTGQPSQTPTPTGTTSTGSHGQTSDPSTSLPKTVDPNAPTSGTTSTTGNTTTMPHSGTTTPQGTTTGTVQTGNQTGTVPTGTVQTGTAQSGTAPTGSAQSGTTHAGNAQTGSAPTDPNAAVPTGSTTGHGNQTTQTATHSATSSTDPSAAGNASTHGGTLPSQAGTNDPSSSLGTGLGLGQGTGNLNHSGQSVSVATHDLSSQISSSAIVVAVLNSMSSHSSQPQVQQKPTVDHGSTTVNSTPAPMPTSTPTSYSQPSSHSGSTTYTPPAASTTSNTDPTSNSSNGSTTISTGTSTTSHSAPAPTQTQTQSQQLSQSQPQSTSEPSSPAVHTPNQEPVPSQPTTTREPAAPQPSPHLQQSTSPTSHMPTTAPTVNQNATLQQQPQSSNPAHSVSNNTQSATSEPAQTSSSSHTGQSTPIQPGSAHSSATTQSSTQTTTSDPSQTTSGNKDDEQTHSHASAATHANATQQPSADPAQNTNANAPTNVHTQTANRAQHQGQPNTAPQPRQPAPTPSHSSSGSHGQQAPAPQQQHQPATAGGSTSSSHGSTQQAPATGTTDPNATTSANSTNVPTASAQTVTTGTGSATDPTAKVGLSNSDPNNDPSNAIVSVDPSYTDPSSSQDPTQVSQDPTTVSGTQDPSLAQDPSQDPALAQDPSLTQDPTLTQEPTTQVQAQQDQEARPQPEAKVTESNEASTQIKEDLGTKQTDYDWSEFTKANEIREFETRVDQERDNVDVVDYGYDPAAERARIEAQVDSYFESQKTDDPPFVDMSGDRVIEKHMPDGTTLLTFNDGVSAWVKGDQVTVIDSEGDISSFAGRIDNVDGDVTIYDANDIIIHSTAPQPPVTVIEEQSSYTLAYSSGDGSKQVQVPSDWTIAFGDAGEQIVSDANGTPMILLDGDSAKYIGPEELKGIYNEVDGDIVILHSTQKDPRGQSSAGRVTLLDFNPSGTDSGLIDSATSVSATPNAIDALGPEQLSSVDSSVIASSAEVYPSTGDATTYDTNLIETYGTAPVDPLLDAFNDPGAFGTAIDPVAGMPIDPSTGLPYNPETGKLLDPSTGQEIGNYVAQDNSNIGTAGIISGDANPTAAENINAGEPHVRGTQAASEPQNLADILNDEIVRIHDNIESRLEEIRNGVHGTRTDEDMVIASFDPETTQDVSSRIDDIEKVADEREQHKQDRIKDEEDRRRDEEEERLKKRKEDIKKLADTMQAIIATKRREEMERVRKLLEQQRKIEEFIVKDTRQSKYTVRHGDTLESIAKKMFKDPRVASLIYDMNKTKVAVETVNGKALYHVKPGTELKLPSPRQAREWVMRGKHMQADQKAADTARKISEKEKAELDDRRKNVESLLGAVGYVAPNAEDGGIKYNVRLGDSLRSVAMKHPMLNDVSLWRLLAEKNSLPTTTDSHGIPTAILKRGTKLMMPTKQEIVDFRKRIGVLTHPASTWLNNTSKDGPESSIHSKKCSDCKRQAPIGVAICPSCGHIFESVVTGGVAKQSFTVVTKPPKAGIPTKDDAITADSGRKSGVKTKDDQDVKDPLVETADDNKVVDLSAHGVATKDDDAVQEPAASVSEGVRTKDESDKAGVKTTEERKPYVSTDPGYNGVPTEEDRTVFVAPSAKTDAAAIDPSSAITQELGDDYENTVVVKDGVITAQLPEDSDSTVIVSGTPKQPIVDGVSASESLIQGISSLHSRGTTGGAGTGGVSNDGVTTGGITTGGVSSQQLQVERFTEQLSETCRLVQLDSSRANKRSTRIQLEVLREGKWSPVIAYEIAAEKSVRHEYSLSGKTKSMKMDLPSGALEAMVQNDLTRNWKSYCEKFLTGKKISA